MTEVGEGKVMSYAKVVNPTVQEVKEAEQKVEQGQEAAPVHEEHDDEGFQEVTNKKLEKLRDKPKRKRKPGPRKGPKEFKEGTPHNETDGSQGSKEVSPEAEGDLADKEEIEYVPAPPPTTNPWKKPSTEAAPASKPTAKPAPKAAAPAQIEKVAPAKEVPAPDAPKTEKKPKSKPVEVKEAKLSGEEMKVLLSSKSNPWKKVDATSEQVETEPTTETSKEGKKKVTPAGSTWPTLAKSEPGSKPPPSKKQTTKKRLEGEAEGKENQVFVVVKSLLF